MLPSLPDNKVYFFAYDKLVNIKQLLDVIGKAAPLDQVHTVKCGSKPEGLEIISQDMFSFDSMMSMTVCSAKLVGYTLTFNKNIDWVTGNPLLTKAEGDSVTGMIWCIDTAAIAALDKYYNSDEYEKIIDNKIICFIPFEKCMIPYLAANREQIVPMLESSLPPDYLDWLNTKYGHEVMSVFVYGTLRPDDDSGKFFDPMLAKFLETSTCRKATIKGTLYFDNYSYLLEKDDSNMTVVGYVYTVPDYRSLKNVLRIMNQRESYPGFYGRKICIAQIEGGKSIAAFTYYHEHKISTPIIITSGDWLDRHRFIEERHALIAKCIKENIPMQDTV